MTTWGTRTIPTTTWTGRPGVTSFQSYTWGNAPDIWSAVSATWDTYGTTTTGTTWTGRIIPT